MRLAGATAQNRACGAVDSLRMESRLRPQRRGSVVPSVTRGVGVVAKTSAASRQRGFTLLELLLVLAVVVAFAGIAWPALMHRVRETAIRRGSQEFRERLGSARVRALEEGIAYRCQFEPGGQWYAILPAEQEMQTVSEAETGAATGGGANGGGANVPAGINAPSGTGAGQGQAAAGNGRIKGYRHLGQLPAGVHFQASSIEQQIPTAPLPIELLSGLPGSEQLNAGTAWSTPILFQPDGTCSGAEFLILNEHKQAVQISLRRLTSGTTMSGLQAAPER